MPSTRGVPKWEGLGLRMIEQLNTQMIEMDSSIGSDGRLKSPVDIMAMNYLRSQTRPDAKCGDIVRSIRGYIDTFESINGIKLSFDQTMIIKAAMGARMVSLLSEKELEASRNLIYQKLSYDPYKSKLGIAAITSRQAGKTTILGLSIPIEMLESLKYRKDTTIIFMAQNSNVTNETKVIIRANLMMLMPPGVTVEVDRRDMIRISHNGNTVTFKTMIGVQESIRGSKPDTIYIDEVLFISLTMFESNIIPIVIAKRHRALIATCSALSDDSPVMQLFRSRERSTGRNLFHLYMAQPKCWRCKLAIRHNVDLEKKVCPEYLWRVPLWHDPVDQTNAFQALGGTERGLETFQREILGVTGASKVHYAFPKNIVDILKDARRSYMDYENMSDMQYSLQMFVDPTSSEVSQCAVVGIIRNNSQDVVACLEAKTIHDASFSKQNEFIYECIRDTAQRFSRTRCTVYIESQNCAVHVDGIVESINSRLIDDNLTLSINFARENKNENIMGVPTGALEKALGLRYLHRSIVSRTLLVHKECVGGDYGKNKLLSQLATVKFEYNDKKEKIHISGKPEHDDLAVALMLLKYWMNPAERHNRRLREK